MKSPKQISIEKKIENTLTGKPKELVKILFNDEEFIALQEYANTVSIKRLHYNDHGPVHMQKVAYNAITIANLLNNASIQLNLEKEEVGTFDDSMTAIIFASLIHDIGMSVSREMHEINGTILAAPLVSRILELLYKNDIHKKTILRSLIMECVFGHMGNRKIHSLEAGIILIADGSDMEKGRARIPMMMTTDAAPGDIHKYSSSAIEKVSIGKGNKKAVSLNIEMSESAGLFQIEEVLFPKINASPIKPYIELYTSIKNGDIKQYL